jgi:hypothetical protein
MPLIDIMGMGPKRTERLMADGNWEIMTTPPAWVNENAKPARVVLTASEYPAYREWLTGRSLIQDALPKLSASQREMLMTGLTDEDFDKIVEEEEADMPKVVVNEKGTTIDVSEYRVNETQLYDLTAIFQGEDSDVDYRDMVLDKPIWSIGRHKVTGKIYGSLDFVFYEVSDDYECVWLR